MRLRTVLRFARLRHVWRGRAGVCAVCDRRTYFLVTDPARLRNDAFCVRCGSISRQRHLALGILEAFRDRGIWRLADFASRADLAVWHTASRGAIARALSGGPVVFTEFFDGIDSGTVHQGVQCQDLQAPTFADASFDLVITEDVLEHVPDYRRALQQIHRVLRPGGWHVFTVPFAAAEPTRDLFERRGDSWIPIGPIEYHEDGLRGRIATYTRFGADFPAELRRAGFDVWVRATDASETARYATEGCTTFVTSPSSPRTAGIPLPAAATSAASSRPES